MDSKFQYADAVNQESARRVNARSRAAATSGTPLPVSFRSRALSPCRAPRSRPSAGARWCCCNRSGWKPMPRTSPSGLLSRGTESSQTLRWSKADSNPRSHSHESFCRGAAEGGSRNEWLGSHFKLWSSREMAIGCAPSPRPVQGETEISNLVCHESLIREWADLKRAACHSISSDRAKAAVHHPARSINP